MGLDMKGIYCGKLLVRKMGEGWEKSQVLLLVRKEGMKKGKKKRKRGRKEGLRLIAVMSAVLKKFQ